MKKALAKKATAIKEANGDIQSVPSRKRPLSIMQSNSNISRDGENANYISKRVRLDGDSGTIQKPNGDGHGKNVGSIVKQKVILVLVFINSMLILFLFL